MEDNTLEQDDTKTESILEKNSRPINTLAHKRRTRRNKHSKMMYLKLDKTSLDPCSSNVVQLNVGGHMYQTTLSTLARLEDCMLGRMFSCDWQKGISKEVFIDRDGRHFYAILNYLRDGCSTVLPQNETNLKELLSEAQYYQIDGLSELIQDKLHLSSRPIRVDQVVLWKEEAVPLYWKAFAQCLNQDGVEYLFSYDRVGKKYNDKQTIATCIGCLARFSVDQITVFDYKIDYSQWEGVQQLMKHMRGVVVESVGNEGNPTCSVVMWGNGKRLHVPNIAIIPADS